MAQLVIVEKIWYKKVAQNQNVVQISYGKCVVHYEIVAHILKKKS